MVVEKCLLKKNKKKGNIVISKRKIRYFEFLKFNEIVCFI